MTIQDTRDQNLHRTGVRGGLLGLLETVQAKHARGEPLVLAIVLATAGSTYQKAGALVLLDTRGICHGVLSGGCLEAELELRARDVLEQNRAMITEFNTQTDEDLVFGSGLGCRGQLWTLLLPMRAQAQVPLLDAMQYARAAGMPLQLTLSRDPRVAGNGAARVADRGWRWVDPNAGTASANESESVTLTISPPRRIALLGAGPETQVLVRLAHEQGWIVWAVEQRERWARLAAEAGIDRLFAQGLAEARDELAAAGLDAVVIMNHHYANDLDALRFCAATHFGYVGLLGPPSRRDELMQALGCDADLLRSRLHAPVGLRLGGHGPEPIALSIAAELLQNFARRDEVAP